MEVVRDTGVPVTSVPGQEGAQAEPVELVPEGDARGEQIVALRVVFSHERGIYDAPITLELSSSTGEGELRYTLDGSDPMGEGGLAYTGPLEITTTTVLRAALSEDGETAMASAAATYLFPEDVPDQAPMEGWPDLWWSEDTGGPYTADYEMDPEVTASSSWAEADPAIFSDLAILSIVMDSEDLFGEDGIHENPRSRGDAWERAASAELFDQESGTIFNVNCGIQIQGNSGRRSDKTPKKSFRLVFKDEFGPGRLNALLYEDGPVTEFNTLVLRASYARSWANWLAAQRSKATYMHEAFVGELYRDMGVVSPRVRPVHLFLNGVYWGLYQVQERPDAAFLASYLGGEEADWDARNDEAVVDGDSESWDELMEEIEDDLSDEDDYEDVTELLDIDRFADFMILELVLGNIDWPEKNWYAVRQRADGEKWFFIPWDSELIMSSTTTNMIDVAIETPEEYEDTPGEIFVALRANEEFLVRFGDRVHKHLFNGGVLTEASMLAVWDEQSSLVVPGVIAESARWGDHWRDVRGEDTVLYTYEDHWLTEYARVTSFWMPKRNGNILSYFQAAGLYPTLAAPDVSPFGGSLSSDDTVTLSAASGTIYYTLDGTDPREEGGDIDDDATRYRSPFRIDEDATLKARAWLEGSWSALVEVDFDRD